MFQSFKQFIIYTSMCNVDFKAFEVQMYLFLK